MEPQALTATNYTSLFQYLYPRNRLLSLKQ